MISKNYQLSLRQDSIFQFPVLPEKLEVSYGSGNTKLRVFGIGEVTIIQDSDAANISFESFFPRHYFSGCSYEGIPVPTDAVNTILSMKNSKKPARLTLAGGIGLSMYCTIESLNTWEVGGDPGTIYFKIKLKEYREVSLRQIRVNVTTQKASISASAPRVDYTSSPRTYTVQKGDCLWNIAIKFYGKGNGNKYTAIVAANQNIFAKRNPNLIYPGETLVIP